MRTETIVAELNDRNPDAYLFENMDNALVGFGNAGHQDPVAVYSKTKIYEKLAADGLSQEDVDEYFLGKFVATWCGKNTPIILDDLLEQ
jgi:hypothetical protein